MMGLEEVDRPALLCDKSKTGIRLHTGEEPQA